MFGLINSSVPEILVNRYDKYDDPVHYPHLLEGEKELQVLCPVSKLTGFPMSIQQAITLLADKNSRLVEMFTHELPTILQLNVSDDEKLALCVSRLDSGSFAENDAVSKELERYAEVFFPEADKSKIPELVEQQVERNVEQNVESNEE